MKKPFPKKESETVEFKLSFDKEAIETLCAFANTSGGSVYIGVSDSGITKGIAQGKETIQKWINQIKLSTSPSIIPDCVYHQIGGKQVVELKISEFPIKPVSCRGRYYKRVKNANYPLDIHEIVDMHCKTFNTS